MPSFYTRYGELISFKPKKGRKSSPQRKKAGKHATMSRYPVDGRAVTRKMKAVKKNPKRSKAKKAPAKVLSKKVGKWRCEVKGRTVYCAGAKKAYASAGVAQTVYKKIRSLKAVHAFVKRYGTKKTCAAVCGVTKTNPTKRAASKKTSKRSAGRKAKTVPRRKNPRITAKERQAMVRVLKRHNYL